MLSLKNSNLLNKESGKAIADALKGNSVLTELDVSSNFNMHNSRSQDGSGFAQELAAGIKDNGALSKLDFSMNDIPAAEADMLNATCKSKGVGLAL